MNAADLDAVLAVLRKQRVRAAKFHPSGVLEAVELEPDSTPDIDIPEEVAGAWKRPADVSEGMSPNG